MLRRLNDYPVAETSTPLPSISPNQIRFIEELSMTALPALQSVYYDGWVLRFAGGYTRRANSVNVLYDSTRPLDEKLDYCERVYAGRRQPTVFKLTPACCPADLDEVLDYRHYRRDSGASVQTASLALLETTRVPDVTLNPALTGAWLMAYFRLNGTQDRFLPAMRQVLSSIAPPKCFAALSLNQEIVALGLGVLDHQYLGLFDVVTRADLRRQGLGKQLVMALLNWGKANGAEQAYLQVVPHNAPALNLYAQFGFREVYPYWYRTKA
jgi:GNAT superfamily N-acetyltransferase